MREHVPRAPSPGPPLGWAPPCAQSSPPRLAGSTDPDSTEELVTELRRALVDLHGSKSIPAFARDDYYNGPIYFVTGPKGRPRRRRRSRCDGATKMRAKCQLSAFERTRPDGRWGWSSCGSVVQGHCRVSTVVGVARAVLSCIHVHVLLKPYIHIYYTAREREAIESPAPLTL